MGEIIKKFKPLPHGFDIELNEPQSIKGEPIIHIQSEKGRLALSKSEFIELALMFNNAADKLKKYKKIK